MTLSFNQRRPVIIGPNVPIYPNDTDIWVNTDNNTLYRFDGTSWGVISSGSATVSGSGGYTYEQIQDVVAPLLNHASHTNITVSYDDANDKILITAPSESIQDAAAVLLNHANHSGITALYNDSFNRIELTNTALDPATASATYLTQANASATYLTPSTASATYITQANASATYIPQSSQQSIINSASGAAVTYLVNSAPSTLDTLNELATALGNDANFSTTVTNSLTSKLNISTASATYLTQSSASANYVTQSQLNSQYNNRTRWTKTYSSSTTSITGLDDNSVTLNYSVGVEEVYLNGVLLTPVQDYTTPGSTVITLGSAVVSGDIIEVVSTFPVNISNVYTQSDANNIFLTQSSASSTYLRQSSASTTYTPLSSPVTSFKNKVINGGFDIWQRGTSFSAGGYTADRWLLQVDGAGATRAVSQQAFTPGNQITNYESQFFLRYNQSVAGSGATFNIIDQRIEDVRTLAGQVVTVSFWAKADSARTITSSIQQAFGTGGSAEVAGIQSGNINITTSWTRYSYTGTLASITGKTIGANSYAAFRINLPLNTTFTVDIWGVQVEKGSIATEYEQRFIGTELDLCQRYYQKSYDYATAPGTATANGAIFTRVPQTNTSLQEMNTRLNKTMRTTPTMTWYSPNTGASGKIRDVQAATDRDIQWNFDISDTFTGWIITTTSVSDQSEIRAQWVASAEL